MRFRNLYVIVGSFTTLLLLFVSDPDAKLIQNLGGFASTIIVLTIIAKGILGAALLYVTRKAMMDYPIADFQKLGENANRTPEGAGLYAIAMAIMTLAFAITIVGAFVVAG